MQVVWPSRWGIWSTPCLHMKMPCVTTPTRCRVSRRWQASPESRKTIPRYVSDLICTFKHQAALPAKTRTSHAPLAIYGNFVLVSISAPSNSNTGLIISSLGSRILQPRPQGTTREWRSLECIRYVPCTDSLGFSGFSSPAPQVTAI